jgi:hypothetical protein
MKKLLLKLFTVIVVTSFSGGMQAQTSVSHELGGFFGISSLQTDFGIKGTFASENQASMAFGLSYYLKFFGSQYNWRSGSTYFTEHFKVKAEFSYINNSKITHEGVDSSSELGKKLDAMTGSVVMYSLGANLEYYFVELEDYSSFFRSSGSVNPFVSVGVHYTHADPDILVDGVSLEGQQEPYEDLIPKWQEGAIFLEEQNIISASAGAGVRFGLEMVDLVLEGRYQYFFSDKLEGLDAPNDPANKNNDTMVFINVGIVYVFGKN